MILQDIVKKKRQRVEERKNLVSLESLISKVSSLADTREPGSKTTFFEALKNKEHLSIIAEVKKASPSKGLISKEFDYLRIAKEYEEFGAACISVLTEEDFFQGSDKYMTDIIEKVNIPILRKDFVIDEYQIYESKLLGASAILLICKVLNDSELRRFYDIASQLGLDCLVETHDEEEVLRAVRLSPKIIGINNRNLDTFEVSLNTSKNLKKLIPDNILTISESGITNGDDMKQISSWGFNGVLVGESLMKSNSIKDSLSEIINGGSKGGVKSHDKN